MYPVSDAFRAAVVSGHQQVVARVSAMLGSQVVDELAFDSGSVTIDGRRDGARRSLSLSCTPEDSVWSILNTPGIELFVQRGLVIDGAEELVPLGMFVIDADIDEDADGKVSVSAADRSQRISRNGWEDPYAVAAGTDVGTAIAAILTDRWPECPIGFSTLGVTVAAQVVFQADAESDPWKDAKALAEAVGYELYFDGTGTAQVMAVPDPMSAPVAATYYGGEQSIVVEQTRTSILSAVRNGVIARGEGSDVDVPLRGVAWDDDPTSPTYIYGPLGKIPAHIASPLLTTQEACDAAAATHLSKIRGRSEQLAWSLIANPAHDAFDVIEFDEDGTRRRFMLDALTVPLLVTEAMPATARETRVV